MKWADLKTQVVNVKTSPFDVYVGRYMPDMSHVIGDGIGSLGQFGNPFKVGKRTSITTLLIVTGQERCPWGYDSLALPRRKLSALQFHAFYLHVRLSRGELDLSALRAKRLGCWCPKPTENPRWYCHAQTLAWFAECWKKDTPFQEVLDTLSQIV